MHIYKEVDTMKRIKMSALSSDAFQKESIGLLAGIAEIESYEERPIPKDKDALADYSFDTLLDGGKDILQGIWFVMKGIAAVAKWSAVLVVLGLKWLWSGGIGSERAKAKKEEKG